LNDAILITEAEPFDEPGPRILWANDVFNQSTGYQPSEIIGKTPRILQGPLTDKSVLETLRKALENWEICRVEVLNYKKDGSTFWSEFEVTPVANEVGFYTHWISVQRDITERRLLEAKLKDSEERYDYAMQGAHVGIWDWDLLTDRIYYSPIWKSMLGYNEDEIGHQSSEAIDRIHPDDKEEVMQLFNKFVEGVSKYFEIELRLQHKSGHYVYVLSHWR
jgi:PAS domain S-box-containing protein